MADNNHLDFGVDLLPVTTENYNLGSLTKKWNNIYSITFTGNLTGTASNITTTASSDSIYLVGVKSNATSTLLHDTSISIDDTVLTAGKLTINGGTTDSSISSTGALTITGTQGTTITSGTGQATTFKIGSTEYGRFNLNGMLQLGDTGTQNTHKLYVNGDSAFNGKIAFGAQASNTIGEKVYIQWNSTDNSLDFVFT